MSSAQPKVTGIFGKSPLLHVLTSLLEHTSTGTLVLETPDGSRSALVLERGVPTKMRLGQATIRLGEILVEMGWLRHDAASNTFEQASTSGQLHGQVLVAERILDEETLAQALRRQLVKKMQWAAALPSETVFGFYEGVDYLSKWRGGSTPVGPLVAIWSLARSRAEPQHVGTMMNRIAGRPLKLHPNAQLRSFGFDRAEMTLLDVLRAKPQSTEALVRLGLVSPHTLERMIYALTLVRHLDFGLGHNPMGIGAVSEREESLLQPKESLRPSRPVVLTAGMTAADTLRLGLDEAIDFDRSKLGSVQTPVVTPLDAIGVGQPTAPKRNAPESVSELVPPRPPARSGTNEASADVDAGSVPAPGATDRRSSELNPPAPAITERRAQIEKLDASLETIDYFEILGVSRDASAAAVQDAYLKAAKTHHPDRLPPELAQLKPTATRIFARMSEAHQTLSDPTKRARYLEQLTRGPASEEDEKVRKVLRAAGAFQKAEVLLKKRMMAAAELEASRALEDDPDQPDYLALCAWIQACKPDSESRLPELAKTLTDAVNRNPNSEKNRFYRVQVLKRLGQIERAVADCRIIVERNPHHVDALREIRLWEMRRSPQKPSPSRGTIPPRTGPGKPSSDRPSAGPHHKKGDPPSNPTGGLLGRLFKR